MRSRKRRLSFGEAEERFLPKFRLLEAIQLDIQLYRHHSESENDGHVQRFLLVQKIWRYHQVHGGDGLVGELLSQLIQRSLVAKNVLDARDTCRAMCGIAREYQDFCFVSQQSEKVIDSATDLCRELESTYSAFDCIVDLFLEKPSIEQSNELIAFLTGFIRLNRRKEDVAQSINNGDLHALNCVIPELDECIALFDVFSQFLSGLADRNILTLFFGESMATLERLRDEARESVEEVNEAENNQPNVIRSTRG